MYRPSALGKLAGGLLCNGCANGLYDPSMLLPEKKIVVLRIMLCKKS